MLKMQRQTRNKKNKLKRDRWFILKVFIIIILIIVILDILLIVLKKSPAEQDVNNVEDAGGIKGAKIERTDISTLMQTGNSTVINMQLPAVDSVGNGVTTILTVEAGPGKGRTFVDIENLLFWADTQQSIRMARLVADDTSEKNVNNYNLVYSVRANASVIGGPSAGSALAIATIAAIEGKKLRDDVTISGTINHDGSIGPMSEVLAKAKAAKSAGATVFLVPLLHSREVVYETDQHCEKFGMTEVCTTETRPRKVNVSEQAGIDVREVANIREAIEYFFE